MQTAMKLTVVLFVLFVTWCAQAQKLTEKFIPIGKSPGLSGKWTLIGKVESVNVQKKTMTCAGAEGRSHVVKITEQTRIWLDNSQLSRTNQVGALTDCKKGRAVEVKFAVKEHKEGPAEWIKVGPGKDASTARPGR